MKFAVRRFSINIYLMRWNFISIVHDKHPNERNMRRCHDSGVAGGCSPQRSVACLIRVYFARLLLWYV